MQTGLTPSEVTYILKLASSSTKIVALANGVGEVIVPEVADGDYGLYTWPAALVLARYLAAHRQDICGQTCVELGAGTGLVGVTAARCGAARVVLTDHAGATRVLDNCRAACVANKLAPDAASVAPLTWGVYSPNLFSLPAARVILGADVLYDPHLFEDLFATVHHCLGRFPPGEARFLTSYQNRSANRTFDYLLLKWGMTLRRLALENDDDGDADDDDDQMGSASVELLEIRLTQG